MMDNGDWLDELIDALDGKTAATKAEAERIILEHGGPPSFETFIRKVKEEAETQQIHHPSNR